MPEATAEKGEVETIETETTDTEATETESSEAREAQAKMYPESYVKKIHTENARRVKTEKELREKLKQYEEAELEAEKDLKKKNDALAKRLKEAEQESSAKITAAERRFVLSEAKRLAREAGIIDADDVRNAIDLTDLRVDDDDSIPGLEGKISELKSAKPHWFKAEQKTEGTLKDDKPAQRKAVATPARKSDADLSSGKWAAMSDQEFRKQMQREGVTV